VTRRKREEPMKPNIALLILDVLAASAALAGDAARRSNS
jgi:hypothetical protein